VSDKILVIGASGLVGSRILARLGKRALGTYCSQPRAHLQLVDVTDADTVDDEVDALRPTAIVLTAAYTHVDGCEQDPVRSHAVNVQGTRNVARAAARNGSRLVFLSSDYVFDGQHGPHDLFAKPAPINVYGRHKLEAERIVAGEVASYAIVRSCNVYGYDPDGKNFVMAVYRCGIEGRSLRVPVDQWGNPTCADDLAAAVDKVVGYRDSGVFHVAGPDYVERLSWAWRTAEVLGLDPGFIQGVSTRDLRQPARRPLNAGLDSRVSLAKLGVTMRGLEEGLAAVRDAMAAVRATA
jgi:dTDP-4-dehydrorhamnose reductase